MPFVGSLSRDVLTIGAIAFAASVLSLCLLFFGAQRAGLDPTAFSGDAVGYKIAADNILNHRVFSLEREAPFYPESFRAPGYPAFLALLKAMLGDWRIVVIVQALVLAVCAPILLYQLLKPYDQWAAYVAAIAFSLEPNWLFATVALLSDAVFVVVFLASLIALDRARMRGSVDLVAGASFLIGLAILIRPIAQFLPLLFVLFLISTVRPFRRSLVLGAVFCGVLMIVVGPWMLRNHVLFDSWSISSVGATNLMYYNAPEFLKYRPSVEGARIVDAFREEQDLLPRHEALSLGRSEIFTNTFREVIRGHELEYLWFHSVKTIPFFLTDGIRATARVFKVPIGEMPNLSTLVLRGEVSEIGAYLKDGGVFVPIFSAFVLFWLAVCALFLLGVGILCVKHHYLLACSLILLVVYFAFLTGPVSNARYRIPVEGFLFFSALVGVRYLRILLTRRHMR